MYFTLRNVLLVFFAVSLSVAVACSDDTQEEDGPTPSSTAGETTATSGQTTATSGQTTPQPDAGDDDVLEVDCLFDEPDILDDASEFDADEDTSDEDVPDEDTSDEDTSDEDTSDEDTSDEDTSDEDTTGDSWPLDGFGAISGACNVLDDELTSSSPFVIVNDIDFAEDSFSEEEDLAFLTEGGQEIIADGNAGGSSIYSEVFSYEVLARCEGATLLKTENEVTYTDPDGKITDFLVEIDDLKVGVSVTRAVGFPREDPYTVDQARDLLDRKLRDVLTSTENVTSEDAWTKQILHIIAYAPQHAEAMEQAHAELTPEVRADTIVWITVSSGDDDFLY